MTIELPRRQKPDRPVAFGYKVSWWALRSESTEAVVEALHLMGRHTANWENGIEHGYKGHPFVTPPVRGWVLVVGPSLVPVNPFKKRESERPSDDELETLLVLSKQFGDVQAFASYRVVGYCLWSKAISGRLVRGFGFIGESGETFWNEGEPVTEEDLGLHFFDMTCPEATSDDVDVRNRYFDREDLTFPDEQHVVQIAGAWSINPTELDSFDDVPLAMGCLGTVAKLLEPD